MKTKKEIMWNNNKWIVDYETKTIYQKASVFEDNPNLLTVQARVGDYPFREFNGSIYFETQNNFYRITGEEVLMISKEEYEKQKKFRKLDAKNRDNVRYVSSYVNSIIIDEVLLIKYKIKISTKIEIPARNAISIISGRFPKSIKARIYDISRSIISVLPYVDKTTIKQEVKNALSSMFGEDNKYFSEMINMIYENDKDSFEQLASYLHDLIEAKKMQDTSVVPGNVSSFESEEKATERKTK